jgi:hypothetical protein
MRTGISIAARLFRTGVSTIPLCVCAVTRRRFPVGASPTRQPLQPEATGAGYARGLHGLKHNSYAHVSAVSVPLDSVPVWSVAAKRAANNKEVMIEHGTPKSEFVKLVYDVYIAGKLTEELLRSMVENLWWIAVITKEEDARLSSGGWRSKAHDDGPKARWAAVGIQF